MNPHTSEPPSPLHVERAAPWWRGAVFYQVYVRSFADSDGDGIGDLPGLRSRLPYLAELGVDAVWLNPFYPSPDFDHGYDVADYCAVDPRMGTLDDFDEVLADAHHLGMRLIVDIVPNHSSSEHGWFRNAVSDPHHRDRERYVFRPGKPDGSPPNNWGSIFGGPAWSPDPARDGWWYLHLFAPEQPDFDWRNPTVVESFDEILRFWLERGVDGFRIDVAHGCLKHPELADNPRRRNADPTASIHEQLFPANSMDHDDVHDVWRRWRSLVDDHPGEQTLVGEVFLWDPDRVARYVRPGELHQAFNFYLLGQEWRATDFRRAIDRTIGALADVGASPTWVLSNHDVRRHVSRFGDGELGLRRARAALLVILGLPGGVFLYQGEELGLPEVDVPAEARQDPVNRFPEVKRPARDGCRVPVPWTADGAPGFGFTTGTPWLPTPDGWGERSVAAQTGVDGSMLEFYRRSLAARRDLVPGEEGPERIEWIDGPDDCLTFRRRLAESTFVCTVNMGRVAASVAAEGRLVHASDPEVTLDGGTLQLPADSTAWLRD